MPSVMIHLLTGRRLALRDDPQFLLGCIAPDYCPDREEKDRIHLRRAENRSEALRKLAAALDVTKPFDAGWLLHLYTDLRWDAEVIPQFRETVPKGTDWYPGYRTELHRAGYELYHRLNRPEAVWEKILRADLNTLNTGLALDLQRLDTFRKMIAEKHRSSPADSASAFFSPELIGLFAERTAGAAVRELGLRGEG